MLTENQKRILENTIYGILKESIWESDDNYVDDEDNYKEDNDDHEDNKNSDRGTVSGDPDKRAKRESVMKWLNSDQSNHAALAYRLYGAENGDDVEQGNARSLFTKKFQGEDAEGKPYNFDDDEITRLYNMKDDYIDSID